MIDSVGELLSEIDEYLKTNDKNAAVTEQLKENKKSINKLLELIGRTEYSAAFIGKIGAGKTSAICKTSGLQHKSGDSENIDILKTGAGRTTVCEVRVEYADKYSIRIDALAVEEVQRVVRNFAEFIWAKANKNITDEDEGGNLLSEELTRCIRNMLGLTIEKKKENGKWKSTDKALEFSRNCRSVDEVNDLMFGCLALEARIEAELWPNPEEAKSWQSWVKETFAKINDGKNKNVSIPALITICGPFPLKRRGCTWKIVDTRGIDSYIHREDIRAIIDTEGIFPIVCSSFVDAPDADCRSFFDLGIKLGHKNRLERDTLLLILDKNESHKVSDIDDEIVDNSERKIVGREIREEQVTTKINHDYKISPTVIAFDSHQDDEAVIWDALEARKLAYLASKKVDLERLVSASREVLSAEGDKVSAFKSEIGALIDSWRSSADSRTPEWHHFGGYIKKLFSNTHHKTLAASIDRKGEFYNLNIYESVNQLAREYAVSFNKKEIVFLAAGLDKIKSKYPEFENQIDSFFAELILQFEQFASDVGDASKQHWIEQVKSFLDIWRSMGDEWGRGPGYKNRVLNKWQEWTESAESKEIHNSLLRRIASAWGRVLVAKQS